MLPSNSLRIASFITREFCFFLLYQKEVPSPVFLFSGLHLPLPCVGFLFLPLDPCFANPTSTLVSSGVSFSLCFPGQVVKCTNLSHLFFFLIEVQLIYNIVPISCTAKRLGFTHIYSVGKQQIGQDDGGRAFSPRPLAPR